MTDSQSSEIREQRAQLITHVRHLEDRTVRLMIRTLHLLLTSQSLKTLAVYLPGVDGGDIWDLPNNNLYFEQEIFSNSTTNVHACIPEALAKMTGVERLEIGYTKDIGLAEEIARKVGANQLVIRTCPEGHTLNLDSDEQMTWRARGWILDGALATKMLGQFDEGEAEMGHVKRGSSDVVEDIGASMRGRRKKRKKTESLVKEQQDSKPGYSEGGRLTAAMFSDGKSTCGGSGGSGDESMDI